MRHSMPDGEYNLFPPYKPRVTDLQIDGKVNQVQVFWIWMMEWKSNILVISECAVWLVSHAITLQSHRASGEESI